MRGESPLSYPANAGFGSSSGAVFTHPRTETSHQMTSSLEIAQDELLFPFIAKFSYLMVFIIPFT